MKEWQLSIIRVNFSSQNSYNREKNRTNQGAEFFSQFLRF